MKRLLLAGTLMALAGCGWQDARRARDSMSSPIIGMSVIDLVDTLGKPDIVQQTGPDTAILEYQHKDTSSGFKLTVSLLGAIQAGGGGGCNLVLTFLRDGTVADVSFPGAYSNGLLSAPYEDCAPLVSEVLAHPSSTGVPRAYDAFVYFLPATTEKKP
jgi:hypothetical protein